MAASFVERSVPREVGDVSPLPPSSAPPPAPPTWQRFAVELRLIELTLERLATWTEHLPGVSRSGPVAAARAYRRLVVEVRKDRRRAELLAEERSR